MEFLTILLFSMPGIQELLLIFAAIVFLFGGKKIPELMKGLGKGISDFKKAKDGLKDELNK